MYFSLIEQKWKNDGDRGRAFLEYFVKFKKDLIKKCMISPIREKCGLGSPPAEYDQNGNECYNSVLKRNKWPGKLTLRDDCSPYIGSGG